jgi:hypothetical protein
MFEHKFSDNMFMFKGSILLFILLFTSLSFAQPDSSFNSCRPDEKPLDMVLSSEMEIFSDGLTEYMSNQQCDPYFTNAKTQSSDKLNFITYLKQLVRVDDRKFLRLIETCHPSYHSSLLIERLIKNSNIVMCDFLSPYLSKLKRSDLDSLLSAHAPVILKPEKNKLKSLIEHDQWERRISPLLWMQSLRKYDAEVFAIPVQETKLDLNSDTLTSFNLIFQQNTNFLIEKKSIDAECAKHFSHKISNCSSMANQIQQYKDEVLSCQKLKIADAQLSIWNNSQEELHQYLVSLPDKILSQAVLNDFQQQFLVCYSELKNDSKSQCHEQLTQKRNQSFLQSIINSHKGQFEKSGSAYTSLINQYNLNQKMESFCPVLDSLDKIKLCQAQLEQDLLYTILTSKLTQLKNNSAVQSQVSQEWQKCQTGDHYCQVFALSLVKLPAGVYSEEDRKTWVDDFLQQHPSSTLFDQVHLLDLLLEKKVEVIEVDYKVNQGSFYCKRPMDVVDTIVIHHTATSENESPERINEGHLNRSPDDPWLMIGYHYLVTQKSQRHGLTPKIYRGRPDNYVGAHAGGEAISREYPETLKNKLLTKKISCGRYPGSLHKVNPTLDESGNTRANDTTLAISFIGNFAAFDAVLNPTGYRPVNKVYYPSDESLREAAQLVCQLKNKYPTISKLGYHQQYKATSCPGSVKMVLGKIKSFAKEYGCSLNLQN